MKSLCLILLSALFVISCGKKSGPKSQNITLELKTGDQSLALTDMANATMGVAGCASGLQKKQTGAPRQELNLPEGESGCYGFLASFRYEGFTYQSDEISPTAFAQGKTVHFSSKNANKLFKVKVESQLASGAHDGQRVAFVLRKARYLQFFPYNKLPLSAVSRLGTAADPLPIRIDALRYRGLEPTGSPRFSLEISCESGEARGKGHSVANSCLSIATENLRIAIISSNEAHGDLQQMKTTWDTLEPLQLPQSPKKVMGRRLLFAKENFTADGRRSKIIQSRRYVLVLAYNNGYHLYPFPLPTIGYQMRPGGKLRRR